MAFINGACIICNILFFVFFLNNGISEIGAKLLLPGGKRGKRARLSIPDHSLQN